MPAITILSPPQWDDYELLDSGAGRKFERFGAYRIVRPETQAIWSPTLPETEWQQADAVFARGTRGDDGQGSWNQRTSLPEQWLLHFDNLAFWSRLTPFRHTGIFPEQAAHWVWIQEQIQRLGASPNVLVLFGYTGIATLVAAHAGARVCHVDASRPAIRWAQENQEASHLTTYPIRWIVDDVRKFIGREVRRGSRYDLILMDPPVFGRGPKGEIWRLQEGLSELVHTCTQLLSDQAVGLLVNAYATTISALTLGNVLVEASKTVSGKVVAGELVLYERTAARPLSTALYARWSRGF
jgi:23S rRNA (cytosine1962-C5)-methyltransferase